MTYEEQQELIEDTYDDISHLSKMLKAAKKVTNQVVRDQIESLLQDERAAKHSLVDDIKAGKGVGKQAGEDEE